MQIEINKKMFMPKNPPVGILKDIMTPSSYELLLIKLGLNPEEPLTKMKNFYKEEILALKGVGAKRLERIERFLDLFDINLRDF